MTLPDGDYIVVPDLQVPFHDARVVAAFVRFVGDYAPDGLLCVGDESDSPEPSRWSKGMAGEYAGTFEKGLEATHDVMHALAQALNASGKGGPKPFLVSRSNHAERLQKYINRYAAALSATSWNKYESILGYGMQTPTLRNRTSPLPITYSNRPVLISKDWVMMHGDEGNTVQSPGGTALSLARRAGVSVVCGHTHRAGMQHHNQGHSGKLLRHLVGLEVGHMMDMRLAQYLGTGAANWQQAFGILSIRNRAVHPQLVTITDRKFVVGGVHYAA